jgi:hypothetical protein
MTRSDANICAFCSYDFSSYRPAQAAKNSRLGCLAIMALVILGILILGGITRIVDDGPSKQEVPM